MLGSCEARGDRHAGRRHSTAAAAGGRGPHVTPHKRLPGDAHGAVLRRCGAREPAHDSERCRRAGGAPARPLPDARAPCSPQLGAPPAKAGRRSARAAARPWTSGARRATPRCRTRSCSRALCEREQWSAGWLRWSGVRGKGVGPTLPSLGAAASWAPFATWYTRHGINHSRGPRALAALCPLPPQVPGGHALS